MWCFLVGGASRSQPYTAPLTFMRTPRIAQNAYDMLWLDGGRVMSHTHPCHHSWCRVTATRMAPRRLQMHLHGPSLRPHLTRDLCGRPSWAMSLDWMASSAVHQLFPRRPWLSSAFQGAWPRHAYRSTCPGATGSSGCPVVLVACAPPSTSSGVHRGSGRSWMEGLRLCRICIYLPRPLGDFVALVWSPRLLVILFVWSRRSMQRIRLYSRPYPQGYNTTVIISCKHA